jgi:hypothetical protein
LTFEGAGISDDDDVDGAFRSRAIASTSGPNDQGSCGGDSCIVWVRLNGKSAPTPIQCA